jgi:hypothetical protein
MRDKFKFAEAAGELTMNREHVIKDGVGAFTSKFKEVGETIRLLSAPATSWTRRASRERAAATSSRGDYAARLLGNGLEVDGGVLHQLPRQGIHASRGSEVPGLRRRQSELHGERQREGHARGRNGASRRRAAQA